jgi:hypothetical protein
MDNVQKLHNCMLVGACSTQLNIAAVGFMERLLLFSLESLVSSFPAQKCDG